MLPGASFELRATVEHRGALVIRTDDGAPLSAEVTNTDPAYRKEGNLGVALETFEPRVIDGRCPRRTARAPDEPPALTNAFVEGSAAVLRGFGRQRRTARGREAPGQPDPDPRRRGSAAHPPADPGTVRPQLGMLRRDARGARHRAGARDGARRRAAPDPAGFDRPPEQPTRHGRSSPRTRSAGSRLSTSISRGPTSPPMTAALEDKRDVITTIDRAFFGELLPRVDPSRTVVAVTADHSTSCIKRAHTADPVPLLSPGDLSTPTARQPWRASLRRRLARSPPRGPDHASTRRAPRMRCPAPLDIRARDARSCVVRGYVLPYTSAVVNRGSGV